MNFDQYGDYLYLYLLLITLIPAIILILNKKSIKYYGIISSFFIIILLMGFRTTQFQLFISFLIGEFVVIFGYLYIRKKTDNKYLYWLFLLMSMFPLIITKLAGLTEYASIIGFIGISYLSFKAIQMIIEIYDGAITKINIGTFICFITFSPTLSSGPIDRWKRFNEDIERRLDKKEYIEDYLLIGIQKIAMGVVYKFVLAYLIHTYLLLKIPTTISLLSSIQYMYVYTLYLFFDFAGYSLFAVGTSYIYGIKTPENFNKPFKSKDMKEFWTRWHISLSRWFGDYIFSRFVLNSMRKKRFKSRFTASHVAQILTMFIMGLWHGFTVYYILYGLYQGIILVLTDIYQRKSKFYKKNKKNKWFNLVQVIVTFHLICFGMLIFSGYLFK